jgi:tetratricopeptide (TPR) repeat protein
MSERTWYQRVASGSKRLSMADRHYERGLYHYAKNKLDLALLDLDAAIEHDPKKAEYYVARGLMLQQEGSINEAEDNFAYGLGLDPTQWLAHYGRGMRAFQEADYDQAVNHFSRAQHIAPERIEIYIHRAIAFHQTGNHEQALRDMEFASTLLQPGDKRRTQVQEWLTLFKNARV